jgi:hypothetical protein
MNGDLLPVSRGLVVALALGFGLFNEILFAGFGSASTAQGRIEFGSVLLVFSAAVGAAVFAVSFVFLLTAKSRHRSDLVVGVIAAVLAAWATIRGVRHGVDAAVWLLFAANVWLAAWWSRGWLRRAIARRRTHRDNRASS